MYFHPGPDPERCEKCRFDSDAYTDDDVSGTLRHLGSWLELTVAGIDAETLNRRPTPTMWSPAEYIRHSKRVMWSMSSLVELLTSGDDVSVDGNPPPDATAEDAVPNLDPEREQLRFYEEAARLNNLWTSLDSGAKAASGTLNGAPANVGGVVRHALHDVTHHLSDIGRGIAELGAGMPSQVGIVTRIGASDGGVPKRAVNSVDIGFRGVIGDRQKSRKHHGRVWQAVCLWSDEVIGSLNAEGHPISPGDGGENLTLAGLDWASIRPGARLRFRGGPELESVELEITCPAVPCSNLAPYFTDRNFNRIDAVRYPGSPRWYAKVIRDGSISTHDPVEVF